MRACGWAVLRVLSVACPAPGSGPADGAATVPVRMDPVAVIARTRWVGMYRVYQHTFEADLVGGVLRVGGSTRYSLRFPLGAGASGPCEIIGRRETYRAIYRLERGRLLICAGVRTADLRPRAFAVTPQSDLFLLLSVPRM